MQAWREVSYQTLLKFQKAHLPKSVIAVLESPPDLTPTLSQLEVVPATPVPTPLTPTVLTPSAPQVTAVKVENNPVPMETQSIQTVQSIQTISSVLVQVNML